MKRSDLPSYVLFHSQPDHIHWVLQCCCITIIQLKNYYYEFNHVINEKINPNVNVFHVNFLYLKYWVDHHENQIKNCIWYQWVNRHCNKIGIFVILIDGSFNITFTASASHFIEGNAQVDHEHQVTIVIQQSMIIWGSNYNLSFLHVFNEYKMIIFLYVNKVMCVIVRHNSKGSTSKCDVKCIAGADVDSDVSFTSVWGFARVMY